MCDLDKMMRICKKCGVEKLLTEFVTARRNHYGRGYTCKDCSNAYLRFKKHGKNDPGPRKQNIKENSRICNECKVEKPWADFHKNTNNKYGHSTKCKECVNLKAVLDRHGGELPEPLDLNATHKVCTKCGEYKPLEAFGYEKLGNYGKRGNCKACGAKAKRIKKYGYDPGPQRRNIEYDHETGLKKCTSCFRYKPLSSFPFRVADSYYLPDCKECKMFNDKIKRYNDRDKLREQYREKYNADCDMKFKSKLQSGVSRLIRVGHSTSCLEILGCTREAFVAFMELQFYNNPETGEPMTWDNYGPNHGHWQVDHIIPLSSFKPQDWDEFREFSKKAGHVSNLQPLWYEDNMSKFNKMPEELPERIILFELKSSDES